jgi:signal transduction histidine kinase
VEVLVGAGRVPTSEDPPVRAEVVHESERTRVTRLFLPGGAVIRKEPVGPGAERRLRHEAAVLGRLRGVAGVVQLADAPRYPESIMLADAGGASLAGLAMPLPAEDLVGLAAGLARAMVGMHARGVLHRDIAPANIVISGGGAPCLVDFALAEVGPEVTGQGEMVGTLAYLAPEATGRTGRAVDQRADLYALGAVLYELATGAPPFGSGDPLRLARDHLARVPASPEEVEPSVPAALSQVIMHLLEKDPDRRYQTADGLVVDLERLLGARGRAAAGWRAGDRDMPVRLLAPSRLAGRGEQVAALEEAVAEAVAGRCAGVLVSGAAGVGKTALAEQLRPAVAARGGWFVAGKFDAWRRDLEFDAVNQAFRSLGRLLLAEPEEDLAAVRRRILETAGASAGLLAATVPEFAALLGVGPEAGDPLTAQVRAQHAAVGVLRAVASPDRLVVVFVDDLQWAGRPSLGLVDLVLTEEPAAGLLLVAAYRDGEVDGSHPLAGLLARWREQPGMREVRLGNLPAAQLAAMVAEMLQGDRAAAGLAGVIEPYTSGNPFETVELINALRRDGVLAAVAGGGWRWDAAAVRAHLGQAEVAGLMAAQLDALPTRSRQLVEAMACLGGRAEVSVLRAATGMPATVMEQALTPALAEGMLVAEPGAGKAVRFRHDRVRELILAGLDPARRRAVQLAMARRLAAVPELFAVAAEQYLPAAGMVEDAAERRVAAGLLRRAARQAVLIGDYALVDALLAAALRLIAPDETDALIEAHTARHAALYGLGRLEQADEEYRALEALCPAVLERADATAVQVRSLTHRDRLAEAVGLGLGSLRELGVAVPAAGRLAAGLDQQFGYLYRWLEETDAAGDLARPEVTDPALLAACRLIDAMLAAAYAADLAMPAWLGLEALRIWVEHGPGPVLIGPATHAAMAAMALHKDYAAGYRAVRRLVAAGEDRGYEPGTSQARQVLAFLACWFEPIDNAVQAGQRARAGLIAGGDLTNAAYNYYAVVYCLVDCAPTLDVFVAEVEAGLAFARRTGYEQVGQSLGSYRWLAGVLRGEGSAAVGAAVPAGGHAGHPMTLATVHGTGAIAAAIFGDQAALAAHTAAAMPLLPAREGRYPSAVTRLLRGLTLAGQARSADGEQRVGLLVELDEVTGWLAARAADAPDNFVHLLRLLEAERAWAAGDFRAAAQAFDAARREAAARQRPWHQALITERAARFYLGHGLDQAGYDLLAQARQQYLAWGATAKAAQLDWAYPVLRPPSGAAARDGGPPADHPGRGAAVTAGTIDLLGIVSASQALSSPTSIGRLHVKVAEVLGAMTGATAVHLALWNDQRQDWQAPAAGGRDGTVPAAGAGREDAVPVSVLRYVQRTGEPLVVADAVADDRFARDPYFAAADCCALLAVPVVSRGVLRAVLVLENRLLRGAFTTGRLDAVQLIAGQLAVSLDNAQLYAELTASRARIVTAGDQVRQRIERDLHDGAQQRLVSLALQLRGAQAELGPENAARLDRAVAEATAAADELQEIARGIHPAVLADGGLRPALKALARRSPVPVDLRIQADGRLPEPVEVSAYYVVAEALTNAAKHARASAVTVQAEADSIVLCVTVRDDGAGGADFAQGTGLAGLKDRVEAIGGRIILHSPRGAGTSLRAEFPLTPPTATSPR